MSNVESKETTPIVEKLESLELEGLVYVIAMLEEGMAAAAWLSVVLYDFHAAINRKRKTPRDIEKFHMDNVFPILAEVSRVSEQWGFDSIIENLLYKLSETYALDSENIWYAYDTLPLSDGLMASIQGFADKYLRSDLMYEDPPDDM